uniref:HDC16902 n=1 Tax=Drosophila melanogaster TaxID=7227 RepID=Q6IIV1_DROME|nr:TPA_inf: HDC16902 [Drosophila melanogaster]
MGGACRAAEEEQREWNGMEWKGWHWMGRHQAEELAGAASKNAARNASRRVGGSLNMDVLYGAAAWRGPEPGPFN